MSNYFKSFPKALYLFGDETTPVAYQDLSTFNNYINLISEEISAYIEYEIQDFERPDSLAYKLYGNSQYDWTFFSINDNIREGGWPLSLQDAFDLATQKKYKDWTCKVSFNFNSADSAATLADLYPVGQEVKLTGGSGGIMYVKSKNLQVGEITVYSKNYSFDSDFSASSALSYSMDSNTLPLASVVREAYGTYEYRNTNKEPIDYFFDTEVVPKIQVTNLDKLIEDNDKLKRIRIIKKELIGNVVGKYKSLIGR
jgi:hypothetical protein